MTTLATLDTSAREYARASLSPRTLAEYRRALEAYSAWCADAGEAPALAGTAARYLAHLADSGRKPTGIGLDRAALLKAFPHLRQDAALGAVWQGIRRARGAPPREARPLLADEVRQLLEACHSPMHRALVAVGWAAALRRSELVGLRLRDVRRTPEGYVLTLPKSKTDQQGVGRQVAVPLGLATAYLDAWLDDVRRGGPPPESLRVFPVTPGWVAKLLKTLVRRIGGDDSLVSGHSLRAGLATQAAMAGKSEASIARTTGHKSVEMLRRYVRRASMFEDNAAKGLL